MNSQSSSADVVIVGGGIMGLGAAWELARDGASVIVLERSVPGAEASSAAAGIVGGQSEMHSEGPLFELALRSRARYPKWADELKAETGIDVELRRSGVMRVSVDRRAFQSTQREFAFQREHGCRVDTFDRARLRREVPALSPEVQGAVSFPEDGRVDPRQLLRALRIAADRASVQFRTGAYARRVVSSKRRVEGVALDDGALVRGRHVLIAAGSWSSLIEGVPLPRGGVVPARGQIVELGLPIPLFTPVLMGPQCYLVPRDDGRVLVGSTLEFVGYRREVTASAVRNLLDAAIGLVPALAEATLNGSWCNFRPYTEDELPVIGEAGVEGLLLATGHYRNGILLAPVTAEAVLALVRGRGLPKPLESLSPLRRPGARRKRTASK